MKKEDNRYRRGREGLNKKRRWKKCLELTKLRRRKLQISKVKYKFQWKEREFYGFKNKSEVIESLH